MESGLERPLCTCGGLRAQASSPRRVISVRKTQEAEPARPTRKTANPSPRRTIGRTQTLRNVRNQISPAGTQTLGNVRSRTSPTETQSLRSIRNRTSRRVATKRPEWQPHNSGGNRTSRAALCSVLLSTNSPRPQRADPKPRYASQGGSRPGVQIGGGRGRDTQSGNSEGNDFSIFFLLCHSFRSLWIPFDPF